nr:protein kinase-like domain, phloem protein 2-like protein [Tanacetum cinerariifolium]
RRPTASDVILQLKKALEFQEDYEIWEPKLPKDYKEIIQMSKCPEDYSTIKKEDLYNIFSKGILLQHDKVLLSFDGGNSPVTQNTLVQKNGGGEIALRTERTRLEKFQALAKENLVESRECLKFGNDDFIQRGHMLNVMPDPLFDVYQYYPSAKELWNALEEPFFMEDATRRLSRHTNSLGKEHWDAVNRVIKYLKKTMDYVLEYSRDPLVLEGYTNASWITDQDDYVHLCECGSEAASYELKGLVLKHSEKPSYRPKASFNGLAQSGLNEREEGYA